MLPYKLHMHRSTSDFLPVIRIQDSWLLRDSIAEYCVRKSGTPDATLTDHAMVAQKIEEYINAWQPLEQMILQGMSEITYLKFRQNIIDVYVVPGFTPFSDPMIVGARLDPDIFVDILTHELLHRLLTDNTSVASEEALIPSWKKLFGNEHSMMTLAHIPVHAIHKAIYLDVLHAPKRLDRDIADNKRRNATDYVKSWDYVNPHGYKEIIQKLKESY